MIALEHLKSMQHTVQVITDEDPSFETKAIEIGHGLLECCFDVGIPKGYLKKSNIFQALWISDGDVTVAFAMVSRVQSTYKLQGLNSSPKSEHLRTTRNKRSGIYLLRNRHNGNNSCYK